MINKKKELISKISTTPKPINLSEKLSLNDLIIYKNLNNNIKNEFHNAKQKVNRNKIIKIKPKETYQIQQKEIVTRKKK